MEYVKVVLNAQLDTNHHSHHAKSYRIFLVFGG